MEEERAEGREAGGCYVVGGFVDSLDCPGHGNLDIVASEENAKAGTARNELNDSVRIFLKHWGSSSTPEELA